MHVFRAVLLVAVVLVGTSEGLFFKKGGGLFGSVDDVKANFLADAKLAALKFKAGAALKKAAVVSSVAALGKAKFGLIDGVKTAKVDFLKGIAAAKLAKLAAIKAGKLAYIKTLAAGHLLANGLLAKKGLGEGPFDLLKGIHRKPGFDLLGGFGGHDGLFGKVGGFPGFGGIVDSFGGFGGHGKFDNPIESAIGGLVSGAVSKAHELVGPLGFGGGHLPIGGPLPVGGVAPVAAVAPVIPIPAEPAVNIHTYQLHPAPIAQPPTIIYAPAHSYAPELSPPAPSYGVPSSHYGPPRSRK